MRLKMKYSIMMIIINFRNFKSNKWIFRLSSSCCKKKKFMAM